MSGFIPVPQNEGGATKGHLDTEWYEFRRTDGSLKWPQVVGGIIGVLFLIGLIVLIVFLIIGFIGTISFGTTPAIQYISRDAENFRVRCSATSSNEKFVVKITWKIDDDRDPNDFPQDMVLQEDGSLIIYHPSQERDEKRKYICVATATEDDKYKEEKKMQINLRIKRPPRFIKTESRPKQLTLTYGEKGQINCVVDAQPPATWTWKCGGVEINNDNPFKDKFSVINTENESTLKFEYIPELFRRGGCSCQPHNEVSTHIITLHTNVTLFYPPVKLHQATFRGDTTVRLITYRDEDKGPPDTNMCFFLQYKISDEEVDDEWKFAERVLTNLDFDVKKCTIEKWKEWRIDGFNTREVFDHLNVVGSAHFDLHGLQPSTGYDVRAMAVSVENGNVPHIRLSDTTHFVTKGSKQLSDNN
ncbi:uncharacterized protein LOC110861161 [Folsomia candida]|uniref:Hemicentin-1 n=1 Tax=Folsomia candida TaxID=158441 RepID=A0A226D5R2_FOLCA|nr:uncharacterized protein LOC110861161 [Folsomia candida]OXA39566.1 Hemicentin-1 [Folsomia candida]